MGFSDTLRTSSHDHRRTLEKIKDKLRVILERTSLIGYQENDADARAVGELAQDVRDAVIEYQVGPNPSVTARAPC